MTTVRPVLGRGLDALIERGQADRKRDDAQWTLHISIDEIDANPQQPRTVLHEASINELAASVRAVGILQPLLVTPGSGSRYTLVAGERRWRAARLAGLREVPVVVTSLAGDELLAAALIENVQREDLGPLEEARAYERLIETTGASQAEIAERVGKSRSTIANALRLLHLPERIRESLANGEISEGHARAILGVPDASGMERLWRRVVDRGLSVRLTEAAARAIRDGTAAQAPISVAQTSSPPDATADDDLALAEEIQAALGTRVRVRRGSQGGKLEIHWYDDEQLQQLALRIVAAMEESTASYASADHPPAHLTV
jgi:ParB family chromosome partitioning protein